MLPSTLATTLLRRPKTALDYARDAQVSNGLTFCLDPAWDVCWPGNQAARDAVGGYQLTNGAALTTTTDDMTFVGVPGRRSKDDYFTTSSGQYMLGIDTNPAWMDDIHQDNATFSIAYWAYVATVGAAQDFVCTIANTTNQTGFQYGFVVTSNNGQMRVENAGATVFSGSSASAAALAGEWGFYAFRFIEATNRIFMRGAASAGWTSASSATSTYASPDTGVASSPLIYGGGPNAPSDGSRVGPLWIWGGTAKTEAELQGLYNTSKARYGIA